MIWRKKNRKLKERIGEGILSLSTVLSLVVTFGFVLVLGTESAGFWKNVGPVEFLTGTRWEPLLDPQSFGVMPLILGTAVVLVGALLIALPVGILSAVYLSEFASERVRSILKPVLEILAGIPTVVFGFFALTFVTPSLKALIPQIEVFNALSASIVVGIMILPMVSSLCDDAFQAVPKAIRDAGYGMGCTSFEVVGGLVIPGAIHRIMGAFILAFSRAIGETMAVTLAAGATPQMTFNPLESVQTMTAYIVQVSLGDTPAGGIEYASIFAVGMLLFTITLAVNFIAVHLFSKQRVEAL